MKLIVAYIQPHKLEDVKQALLKAEVGKMSVTNALGCGAQRIIRKMERDFDTGYETGYKMQLTNDVSRKLAVLDRI